MNTIKERRPWIMDDNWHISWRKNPKPKEFYDKLKEKYCKSV